MKSFTLVETLIAVFVFTLIIVLVFSLIVVLYRTYGYTWQQSVAVDEARRGVKTMVREIRESRLGDDGSFAIEKAGDKEFIFYSDIDEDNEVERVRYFLGGVSSGSQTQNCVTFVNGGSCSVSFSNFLEGELKLAEVTVSVEGDFGQSSEYADIYADGNYLGRICQTGCLDCPGVWQGVLTLDVINEAADNFIQLTADASSGVNSSCSWEEPNHKMKAKFEFFWEEEISDQEHQLKKGVINPVGWPIEYPQGQEEISILSSYVRNSPPIFEYFDEEGNEIEEYPVRLVDTKLMKIYLVVNVDPNRPPANFELESYVQLRNLKEKE